MVRIQGLLYLESVGQKHTVATGTSNSLINYHNVIIYFHHSGKQRRLWNSHWQRLYR